MNASQSAEAEPDMVPLWKIINVTDGHFGDPENFAVSRIPRRKQFVLLDIFHAAKNGVGLAKVDERFQKKSIQVGTGMLEISAPGEGSLPMIFVPGVVVRN